MDKEVIDIYGEVTNQEFNSPEDLYEEVMSLHTVLSVFTVTNNEGGFQNFVIRKQKNKDEFTEGSKKDFLKALKENDALLIRNYTGKLVAGNSEVKLRAYVIDRTEEWKSSKMSAWDLRENCTRDPETGDLMPPKVYEEYC